MLWVAMMGIHLGCRDRLKNFSSPVGSLLADRGEVLILVAEKEHLPEIAFRILLHHGTGEHAPVRSRVSASRRAAFGEARVTKTIGKLRQHKGGGGRLSVRAVKGAGCGVLSERQRRPFDRRSGRIRRRV